MQTACEMSDDDLYRYTLSRQWDADKPVMVWIMLNPSTADATVDDPTIRKCIGFARSNGAGGIRVVNCYALRATDPSALKVNGRVTVQAIGPENRRHVFEALLHAKEYDTKVVCAWGATIRDCGRWIVDYANNLGVPLWCLGKTMQGEPKHPLYLRGDTNLEPYP